LAPVICINDQFHANVTNRRLGKILDSYRKRATSDDDNN
jgi:NADH:ubiquinone oxidoreductase subunit E